jgi:3-dehydroquinate synthase
LSLEAGLISKQEYEEIVAFFGKYYAKVSLPEAIYPDLFDRMKNDKKNEAGHILCTLLDGIGQAKVNQQITQPQAEAALRAYG